MKQALKKAALVVACAGGMAATMQVEVARCCRVRNVRPLQGEQKYGALFKPSIKKISLILSLMVQVTIFTFHLNSLVRA